MSEIRRKAHERGLTPEIWDSILSEKSCAVCLRYESLFYLVLLNVCQQVAQSLNEPLERISVEMVFRAFYHYSRALMRGETVDLAPYLVHHAKLLGLVKRQRTRHREIQQTEQLVWGSP